MRQYNIDFFDRTLYNIHHDVVGDLDIEDDYISFQRNSMEISYTETNLLDAYIYIVSGDFKYFGVVVSAEPTSNNTVKVVYKNFLSLFDEDISFDVNLQERKSIVPGYSEKVNSKSLEGMLKYEIDAVYKTTTDLLQRLPINTVVDSDTRPWSFNYITDTDGEHHCIIGLYKQLIVNAMKMYGVGITVEPNFTTQVIDLTIKNQSTNPVLNIDGDLPNVVVKTCKVNDRPQGVNKLTVHNTDDYNDTIDFYVYTDRTWGVDPEQEGKTRIAPVVRAVRTAMPDSTYVDPAEGFAMAAIDVAYGVLSGLQWDNLIELEVAVDDPIVTPFELAYGQKMKLWYKDNSYESILTGRKVTTKGLTLMFGSERIQLTKRSKW